MLLEPYFFMQSFERFFILLRKAMTTYLRKAHVPEIQQHSITPSTTTLLMMLSMY